MFVDLYFSNFSSTHGFNELESQTCRIFQKYVVQVKTRLSKKSLCQYIKWPETDLN